MAEFWFWFLLFLLLFALFAVPAWPHARGWGFGPSGGALLGLAAILVLVWGGFLTVWWPWATIPY